MLDQIFTKKFLMSCRRNAIVFLSLLKYILLIVGVVGFILCATGVDAPDPYGFNAAIACIVCMAMIFLSILIEMFVVRFLIKNNEHIRCIFNFSWYGLKNTNNYIEYIHNKYNNRNN